jgi:predicted transcriptional regulator
VFDMGMYTIVQLVVLIGFALSFKVLMPGKAEWYNWTAFVTVFRLMIGDADDMEPFLPALNDDTILDPKLYAGTETVAIILWMVYTGVIVIVMINMLIAQMSDSFDRAQEVENALALQERARVISQIIRYNIRSNEKGCCMRKRKRNYNIFPKWLYVLLPSDKTLKLRRQTQQQWTGRLKSIKNNMDIAIATLSEKLMTALEKSTAAARTDNAVLKELLLKTPSSDGSVNTGALQDQNKQLKDELTKTVEKSVNNLRNDIGENQGKFTERIGGLEKNVDDLKANVDKILELLAKNTEKTS